MFLCKHISMPFCVCRREFTFPSIGMLAHGSWQCLWPDSLIRSICSTLSSLSAKAEPLGKMSKKIKAKCRSFVFLKQSNLLFILQNLLFRFCNRIMSLQVKAGKKSRSCRGFSEQVCQTHTRIYITC